MRLAAAVVAAVLLSLAGLASADFCPTCKGKAYTKDIGTCKDCGGPTLSGQHEVCIVCSGRLRQCEHCRASVPDVALPDVTRGGTWKSNRWEYRVTISNEGSKSEGRTGELLVDAKPLPAPSTVNDHVKTPWGLLWWVGNPPVAFGSHGWMPKPAPARPFGRLLADPAGSVATVLWMTLLSPGQPGEDRAALEPWMTDALKAQGVAESMVASAPEALGATPVVLHDSKHYGRAEARLQRAAPGGPVSVEITGTEGPKVEMPLEDGRTAVVKHVLESQFGPYVLWIAFRLEVAPPPR